MRSHHLVASLFVGTVLAVAFRASAIADASLDAIQTIVVLYAENRSFDHLFGVCVPKISSERNGDEACRGWDATSVRQKAELDD